MWWILIPLMFLSSFSFAQDAVEEDDLIALVIENPKIPKQFSETEKNQSGKIILKATTKVKGYQIIIGDFDPAKKAKFQVHVVEVEVIPDARSNFTLTARLFDEKSKKLINKVTFENVEKMAYFRELERLMNELFLPVSNEREKEQKKIENKRNPPAAREKSPPTESETASLNFKERIMALKSGVDSKIKEVAEAKKNEVPKVSDSLTKKEPPKTLAEVPANNSEKELTFDKPPLKHPAFENLKPTHKAGILYKSIATNSKHGVIDLDTKLTYVGLSYSYQRPVIRGHDHFWQGEIELAKPQSKDDEFEFSPYGRGNAAYGYLFRRAGLFLRGGLDVDTLSFTNLPEEGKGFKVANVRTGNYFVGAQWAGVFLNQPVIAGVDYTKPFYFMSDNAMTKTADLSGQSIRASFTLSDLYFHLNLKLDYYITSYDFASDEAKLTTSSQGFGVHVNYVF